MVTPSWLSARIWLGRTGSPSKKWSAKLPSLNRPGGNVTGITFFAAALERKRLGLLHELIPQADVLAVLLNPNYSDAELQQKDIQEATREIGQRTLILTATTDTEIDTAFATLAQQRVGALLVCADPLFDVRRERIVALSTRHRVPAIYHWREYVTAGGLLSYGASLTQSYRKAGLYAGRVLKGIKPADLPVMQPTKFELVINLKIAKTLGLDVPPMLLARADEVIEWSAANSSRCSAVQRRGRSRRTRSRI
jgi:putative tryptophan/tyrosine transport system substrate-binding protein